MRSLNEWLSSATRPARLVICAPAGRGKSALLVNWARQIDPSWSVVFVPISIRFGTATERPFFPILAARLAEAHREDDAIPPDKSDDPMFCRAFAQERLNAPLPGNRRLLLIIDGLDEAIGWQFGGGFFPLRHPAGLKIVVSAREQAGESGAESRIRSLNWDSYGGLAEAFTLSVLTKTGIADVMASMGVPLSARNEAEVLDELFRLTEGDPLLVRFYVEDLWTLKTRTPELTPSQLKGLANGYQGYFQKWIEDQRALWGQDTPFAERALRVATTTLSLAKGPLTSADMKQMLRRLLPNFSGLVDAVIRPMQRFIIGDGTEERGYVFAHPRLSEFFYSSPFVESDEVLAVNDAFVKWGKDVLIGGERTSNEVSPYLIRCLGLHLSETASSDLEILASNRWRLAWYKLEGGYAGFATDVRRLFHQAKDDVSFDRMSALGQEVRSALCLASIASLSRNIDAHLLSVAVLLEREDRRGSILNLIRNKADASDRVSTLTAMASLVPLDILPSVLKQIVSALRVVSGSRQLRALTQLLPHITKLPNSAEILEEFITIVEPSCDAVECIRLRIEYAALVANERRLDAIAHVMGLIKKLEAPPATWMLACLIEALPNEDFDSTPPTIFRELQSEISKTIDQLDQIALLSLLLRRASEEMRRGILQSLLEYLSKIAIGRERDICVRRVIDGLNSSLDAQTVNHILGEVHRISDDRNYAGACAALAPCMDDSGRRRLFPAAWQRARQIGNLSSKTYAFVSLLEAYSGIATFEDLRETILSASQINDHAVRCSLLLRTVKLAPVDKCAKIAKIALISLWPIFDPRIRARALAALANHLPDQAPRLCSEAIGTLVLSGDHIANIDRLTSIVDVVPGDARGSVVDRIVTEYESLNESPKRLALLVRIYYLLPPQQQHAFVRRELSYFEAPVVRYGAPESMVDLIRQVPRSDRKIIVDAILPTIDTVWDTAHVLLLRELADTLPDASRETMKSKALARMQVIADYEKLARAGVAILEYVSAGRVRELVDFVTAQFPKMEDYDKIRTLHSLVKNLLRRPDFQQTDEFVGQLVEMISDGQNYPHTELIEARSTILSFDSDYADDCIEAATNWPWRERIDALRAIVRRVPAKAAAHLLKHSISLVQENLAVIPSFEEIASQEVLGDLLDLVEHLDDEWKRVDLLLDLALHMSSTQREKILDEALAIMAHAMRPHIRMASPFYKVWAYIQSLRPTAKERSIQSAQVPFARLMKFFTRMSEFELSKSASRTMRALGDYLLDTAGILADPPSTAKAQALASQYHSTSEQNRLAEKCLGYFRTADDTERKFDGLLGVLSFLPDSVRARAAWGALNIVQSLNSELHRSAMLKRWMSPTTAQLMRLDITLAEKVIEIVNLTKDKTLRVQTLGSIAKWLPQELSLEVRDEIRQSIDAILHTWNWLDSANDLVPFASPEQKRSILRSTVAHAQYFDNDSASYRLLSDLIDSDECINDVADIVLSMERADYRDSMLMKLAGKKLSSENKKRIVRDLLDQFSEAGRDYALLLLPALLPQLSDLGGAPALDVTFGTLQDVAEWWP